MSEHLFPPYHFAQLVSTEVHWATMGKSVIKIHTRVPVQLRLTNHCLRPLSIRILRMGPQLQCRLLTTVLPSPLAASSVQDDQQEHLQGKKNKKTPVC